MLCKVKIKKAALNYFRSKARDSNLEIEAYLIGTVVSPTLTIVHKVVYTKNYAEQTTSKVQWWVDEYNKVVEQATAKEQRVVGSIHSHPSWDCVMSPSDYQIHVKDGFRILGICSTQNRKTRVRFWIPESALPCKLEYI